MKRAFAFVLLAFSAIALAQAPQIKSGDKVYIEPADGFETFLAAAMIEYKVPLVVVTDKDKADYIIRSNTHEVQMPSWSTPYTYIGATFSVIDQRSSQVVFAGSTSKNYYLKAAAGNCAKQLKKFIK